MPNHQPITYLADRDHTSVHGHGHSCHYSRCPPTHSAAYHHHFLLQQQQGEGWVTRGPSSKSTSRSLFNAQVRKSISWQPDDKFVESSGWHAASLFPPSQGTKVHKEPPEPSFAPPASGLFEPQFKPPPLHREQQHVTLGHSTARLRRLFMRDEFGRFSSSCAVLPSAAVERTQTSIHL